MIIKIIKKINANSPRKTLVSDKRRKSDKAGDCIPLQQRPTAEMNWTPDGIKISKKILENAGHL
jgi:hypothetical protein